MQFHYTLTCTLARVPFLCAGTRACETPQGARDAYIFWRNVQYIVPEKMVNLMPGMRQFRLPCGPGHIRCHRPAERP